KRARVRGHGEWHAEGRERHHLPRGGPCVHEPGQRRRVSRSGCEGRLDEDPRVLRVKIQQPLINRESPMWKSLFTPIRKLVSKYPVVIAGVVIYLYYLATTVDFLGHAG